MPESQDRTQASSQAETSSPREHYEPPQVLHEEVLEDLALACGLLPTDQSIACNNDPRNS